MINSPIISFVDVNITSVIFSASTVELVFLNNAKVICSITGSTPRLTC